ncbi:pyridoxamine 5'-phosphate oxidase family protein [Undibacterium sp. RuTC16W]|uniref:pyridoxamine 5'-phosphate oxidase family protein n=1 Tax=Undibacterium sp. RuTC16W TaxID=3413048 RepID=UPI003BF2F8BB
MTNESIIRQWPEIRRVVELGQRSSLYCSIGTVDRDGVPNVTPIGTVFLNSTPGGFFFDRYTSALAANLESNNRICLLAVDSRKTFWLRSLVLGRFSSPPGVRLYGTAGPLRAATEDELQRIEARVQTVKRLKGGRLLWSSFTHVRDLSFSSFRPVSYPIMMEELW